MKKQPVEFKVGKDALRGTLFIPSGKSFFPGVISFHGSGGRGEKYFEWGEKLARNGFLFFAFNFRGCGKSDGDFKKQTFNDAILDAKTAFDFFAKQKMVDPKRIGMVGGSFGGFLASMLCLKLDIKSLILLAPSAHKDKLNSKIYLGDLGEEVKYFQNRKNWFTSPSYINISKFTKPLLILKSEYDENVPSDVVDRYFENADSSWEKKIKTINAADHRLSKKWMRDEAFEFIKDWFLDTL